MELNMGRLIITAAVIIAVFALVADLADRARRAYRRWRTRRFLRLYAGGRREVFTGHGDLVERPARPTVHSIRSTRGDHDAA